ncbi:MAG: hypothetical protein HUU29_07850 [Planctomycetaceae bacterium]|nr:hypothetical protein [Planctomycetaceae bacterium]
MNLNPTDKKDFAAARPRRLWLAFILCLTTTVFIFYAVLDEAFHMVKEAEYAGVELPLPWDYIIFFGLPIPIALMTGIILLLRRKASGLWVLAAPALLILVPIIILVFKGFPMGFDVGNFLELWAIFTVPSLPFWIALSCRRWLFGQRS